jgi:ribosomal-protein-alanine N-acetyltransferase
MSGAIQLVRLEDRDVGVVAAIDALVFPQSQPTGDARLPTPEERLRDELARPWSRAWVVRESERVVAYCLSWHVVDELHILQVASAPDERRRGFGRALVNEALAYAAAERVRLVLLEVRRSNEAAIALYRRVGFAAVHVRRAYYTDGEDAVEMLAELDPATGARVSRADEVTLPG